MTTEELYLKIGGNYKEALSRLMNEAFIKRMLGKFVETDYLAPILEGYKEENIRKVFEGSHALKGVAGNLSFTALFEASSTLTELTRSGENKAVDKEVKNLAEVYKTTVDSIKEFLNQ